MIQAAPAPAHDLYGMGQDLCRRLAPSPAPCPPQGKRASLRRRRSVGSTPANGIDAVKWTASIAFGSCTSRATARRAGVEWSGCSAPFRAACHRSCARRGSPRSRLSTGGSRPATRPTTTPGSGAGPPRHGGGSCRPPANTRFAVAAAEEGTAFVPFVGALEDILCVQDERVVGNDNTVRYGGRVLQIPEQRHRRHFVKVTVRVRQYPDGRLAIFHGPPCRLRGGRNPNQS